MSLTVNQQLKSGITYYSVYLLSNDTLPKEPDVFLNMRKGFFEQGNKKQKDKIFLSVNGESVRYQYVMDNNRPLKWKRENEGKITQRASVNGASGYILETLDYSGTVIKKEYYTSRHQYEKTEYYDGFSATAYLTLVPCITDKYASFALYKEGEKRPQILICAPMPTDEKIVKDLVLEVSPELAANTSGGFAYFCSEEKLKQWNKIIDNYNSDANFNASAVEKKTKNKPRFIFNVKALKEELEKSDFNIKSVAVPFSLKINIPNKPLAANDFEAEAAFTPEKKELFPEEENDFSSEDYDAFEQDEITDVEESDAPRVQNGYGRTQGTSGKTIYEGEYKDGEQNGFGVYYYKTGRISYVGNWSNNMRNGFGVSFRPTDGCVQVGMFKDDKPHSIAARFDKNGRLTYAANYKDGEADGAHIAVADNGNLLVTKWENGKAQKNAAILSRSGAVIYSGEIKNNKKDGFGVLFDERGSLLYRGSFKNDMYNGQGTLYFDNGATLSGEFKDNALCGAGVERDESGFIVYRGDFSKNRYNGTGTQYFENGSYKTGEFIDGKPTGDFSLFADSGELIYKGGLIDSTFDGKGALYSGGELVYDGAFAGGEKCGMGREFENSVCVYMGEFENDRRNGFGIIYNGTKQEYIGYFKDNKKSGNGILFVDGEPKYAGEFSEDLPSGRVNIIEDFKVCEECVFEGGECVYARRYTPDGALTYDGSIKNGQRDGMGCAFSQYGDKAFEGIFKYGEPYKSMKVITKALKPLSSTEKLDSTIYKSFIYPPNYAVELPLNGGVYSGQTDENGLPNGKGTMLYSDHKYAGMFKNGKASGNGVLYFDDGTEKKVFITDEKTDDITQLDFAAISYYILNQ
ncbi:MAG: hypothetical protein ACI4I4_02525 [Acutalibacteraceae bacterium]